MELLTKRFYRPVPDPMQMPQALKQLAAELVSEGYNVSRRSLVIVIELENGQVHFTPGRNGIWEHLFLENGKGEPNHASTKSV